MLRFINILALLTSCVSVACTRATPQAASDGYAARGKTQVGEDRPLPGYLVWTTDSMNYAGYHDDRIGVEFPSVNLAYVLSESPSSNALQLDIRDADGQLPMGDWLDMLWELCTFDPEVAGMASAIFHGKQLMIPSWVVNNTADASCFAARLSALLTDTVGFVRIFDENAPEGLTRIDATDGVLRLIASWTDEQTFTVSFETASNVADLPHAIAIGVGKKPPMTCGGGELSELLPAGVTSAEISRRNSGEDIWVRVCSLHGDIASYGEAFLLAAADGSENSSSNLSPSDDGELSCPSSSVTIPDDPGSCYFLGYLWSQQSCEDVCADHSMRANEATIDLIGHRGVTTTPGYAENRERCQDVMRQLTETDETLENITTSHGLGCFYRHDMRKFFWDTTPTTLSGSAVNMQRVCACK